MQMVKHYFIFGTIIFVVLFLFGACQKHVHDSNVSCDITMDNEYIIKWDIFPKAEGNVNIYISDTPDSFDTDEDPIVVADADDGVVSFPTPDSLKRYYFLLDFNDCFSRIVAARASFIQSAYAFRDLGGYSGENNKKTRWGMIYRIGTLDTLTAIDKQRVINIAPKTIIEYRSKELCEYSPQELGVENVIYLPTTTFNVDSLIAAVYEGNFSREGARVVMNNYYMSMIDGDAKQSFVKLFETLENEDNYPIIISSQYGKGFNDLASLFILTALGVSSDEIYEDYSWANKYFCKGKIMQKTSHLPEDVREGVASIMHNNHRDMVNLISNIQNRYLSIDKFIADSLKLDLPARQQIQEILLVDESNLLD